MQTAATEAKLNISIFVVGVTDFPTRCRKLTALKKKITKTHKPKDCNGAHSYFVLKLRLWNKICVFKAAIIRNMGRDLK